MYVRIVVAITYVCMWIVGKLSKYPATQHKTTMLLHKTTAKSHTKQTH